MYCTNFGPFWALEIVWIWWSWRYDGSTEPLFDILSCFELQITSVHQTGHLTRKFTKICDFQIIPKLRSWSYEGSTEPFLDILPIFLTSGNFSASNWTYTKQLYQDLSSPNSLNAKILKLRRINGVFIRYLLYFLSFRELQCIKLSIYKANVLKFGLSKLSQSKDLEVTKDQLDQTGGHNSAPT